MVRVVGFAPKHEWYWVEHGAYPLTQLLSGFLWFWATQCNTKAQAVQQLRPNGSCNYLLRTSGSGSYGRAEALTWQWIVLRSEGSYVTDGRECKSFSTTVLMSIYTGVSTAVDRQAWVSTHTTPYCSTQLATYESIIIPFALLLPDILWSLLSAL